MKAQRLYNPLVIRLLCSPLHVLMSGSVLLLTFEGRRSDRSYTTPVNYVRRGDDLLLVSSREHSWWKNLRGGAPVTLRVRGRKKADVAEAFEGRAAEEGLLAVLRAVPSCQRHWKVDLDPDGRPRCREDLTRIAEGNILVRAQDLAEVRQT